MDSEALETIAARLFDAFVAADLDTVGEMLAPGAILTQNGNPAGWADARPMIEGLRSVLGDHHYTHVRRVTGDHAVVEEHRVISTTPDGRDIDLAACVVLRVDGDGLITSLDEYVDPTSLFATG